MNLMLVVACALVDADRRVLICQRPEGKHMAGLWEFPGGKLEAGETPEAALIRELAEELAIDVDHACLAPACFASDMLGDRSRSMPARCAGCARSTSMASPCPPPTSR